MAEASPVEATAAAASATVPVIIESSVSNRIAILQSDAPKPTEDELHREYIEIRNKISKYDHTPKDALTDLKIVMELMVHYKRLAEILILGGHYAEARMTLLTISALFNSSTHAHEKKPSNADFLFPELCLYDYYILCCECMRDMVGANSMARGVMEMNKQKHKTLSDKITAIEELSKTAQAQITKCEKKIGGRKTIKQKIIQQAIAEIKKAEVDLEPLRKQRDALDIIVREWEFTTNDLLNSFTKMLDADKKSFIEEHGNVMPLENIDRLMMPRYDGGIFTPGHVLRIEDYRTHSDVKSITESLFESDYNRLESLGLIIQSSPVHGKGLFTGVDRTIRKGEEIARFYPAFWATVEEHRCAHCGAPFPGSKEHEDFKYVPCEGECGEKECYCSHECRDEAKKLYHSQMCTKGNGLDAMRASIRKHGVSSSSRAHMVLQKIVAAATKANESIADSDFLLYFMKETLKRTSAPGFDKTKFMAKSLQGIFNEVLINCNMSSTDPRFDFFLFCTLTETLSSMLFTTGKSLGRDSIPSSVGLYAIPAYINHTCYPNARWSTAEYDPISKSFPFILTAKRDIKPSEEIFITYVDEAEISEEQRATALKSFGFVCNCLLCEGQRKLTVPEQLEIIQNAFIKRATAEEIKQKEETETTRPSSGPVESTGSGNSGC